MATHHSTALPQAAILGKIPAPLYSYDNWLLPPAESNQDAHFAAVVMDVARGTRAIAGILAMHLTDMQAIANGGAEDVRPLLRENEIEALARLAVFSLHELNLMASSQVDRLNAESEKGAKS